MSWAKGKLERLGNALLAANKKPEIVLRMIAEREKKLAKLNARLAGVRASPLSPNMDYARIERAARERIKELHGMFSRHPEATHCVMEVILGGPAKSTPADRDFGQSTHPQ